MSVPERREHQVTESEAGRTVARILHDHFGASHRNAHGLIAAGCVRRNDRAVARPDERVAPGDRVTADLDPGRRYRAPRRLAPGRGYVPVHEDEAVLVVDKAPGVLTVRLPGEGSDASLTEILAAQYQARGQRRPFVRAVHRIDRFTSGLVAFALSPAAWHALRAQFTARAPERLYLAVAAGRIEPDSGALVHRLRAHPSSHKVRTVRGPRGQDASCTFRVTERFAHATLLEVRLETGRRNQIRVQLASEGHPLVGDRSYGGASPLLARTALHAWRLVFDHPGTGETIRLQADPPADFRRLLAALRRGADPHSPTRTRTPL